jgi:hypothetical protein
MSTTELPSGMSQRLINRVRGWRLWRWWPWLPVPLAVVYAVVFVLNLRVIVHGIYLSADSVSALYIGELYEKAPPDAEVVLGNFPWYTTLWFEQLTHGLPHHRQIWEVAPWVVSMAGVALTAWSVGKAAGRWAAVTAAVVLACAGPALLNYFFSASIHSYTFAHASLLAAFLVLLADRGGKIGSWPVHVAVCAAVAAITAAGLASDHLLAPAGLIPLALAAGLLAWLLPAPAGHRVVASAVSVAVAAVAGGVVIEAIMRHQHVVGSGFDLTFAQFRQVPSNLTLFVESLSFLFNGEFGGQDVDAKGLLTFACAVVVFVGLVVAARFVRSWSRQQQAAGRGALDPRTAASEALVAFSGIATVIMAASVLFTSLVVDKYGARYLVSTGYALVTLLLILAARARRRQALAVAGTCVVVVASIAALIRDDIRKNPQRFPDTPAVRLLRQLAAEQHLTYGYAGYWDAATLTWQAKAAVEVYPVSPCSANTSKLCPFRLHRISSWYQPRPNTRSFLIVDATQPLEGPVKTDRRLGKPASVRQISELRIYIYDYDIASRFGEANSA